MNRRHFISLLQYTLIAGMTPALATTLSNGKTIRFVCAANSPPFSMAGPTNASGYLPEVLRGCCDLDSKLQCEIDVFPWTRAQWMVKNGVADGFCTFPSTDRQQYALFTQHPLFNWDFGNLVFRKNHPQRAQLEGARSWDDLDPFTMIGQHNTGWEEDNVPSQIQRETYSNQEEMLQVLLRRGEGDFIIMSALEAKYHLRELSLESLAQQSAVSFIENALIPFHIGIGRHHPNAEVIIARLDDVIQSDEFDSARKSMTERYL